MKTLETPSFSKTRSSAGYTLAELAICLCIIGILTSGGIIGSSHYFRGEETAQTRRKIDFVMNVLSAYAQTHYRLPCPADPKASEAQAGREEDKCVSAETAEGIVPWKELAIPQEAVVDAGYGVHRRGLRHYAGISAAGAGCWRVSSA